MAHNLTVANGRVEMAYAGDTPWHGLGVKVEGLQTVQAMQEAAGLTWTVSPMPVFCNSLELDGYKAVVRGDNGFVLGVVSDRYVPIQNVQAFDTLDAIVAEGSAVVETAGSIKDGRRVWALAKLPGTFEVVPGDAVEPYVLVSWGHNGKNSLEVRLTPVRVVCNNTLDMASKGRANVSIRHSANAKVRIDEARTALGLIRRQVEDTAEAYRELATFTMSEYRAKGYFAELFPAPALEDGKAYQEKLARWNAHQGELLALFDHGKGSTIPGVAGTAWAAYNAVTEWTDHVYPVTQNGSVSAARQESALFGSYADVKTRALELALAGK